MYNLESIFKKAPDELTVEDLFKIQANLLAYEVSHRDAILKTELNHNCLLIDALGFQHEYNYRKSGYSKPPREIYFAVRARFSYKVQTAALTTVDDVRNETRVFKLTKFRNWDRMPIYEEY